MLNGLKLELPHNTPELWGWLESAIHLVQRARSVSEPERFDALSYWYWGEFDDDGATTTPGLLHAHMWEFAAQLQEVTEKADPQFSGYLRVLHSVAIAESGVRDGLSFLTYAADLVSGTPSNCWEILLETRKDGLITRSLVASICELEKALARCEGHLPAEHLEKLRQIPESLKSKAAGEKSALNLIRDQFAHGKASVNLDGGIALDVQLQLLLRAAEPTSQSYLVRGMDPVHVDHLFRMMNAFGVIFYGAAETARFHWALKGQTRGPAPSARQIQIARAQLERTIPDAPRPP